MTTTRIPILALLLPVALMTTGTRAPASAQTAAETRATAERLLRDPPGGVPRGSIESALYLLDTADRIRARFGEAARSWERRAAGYVEQMERGVDPYPLERGRITNRGYVSEMVLDRQGYAIYVPRDYDPATPIPLYIALHGGSSNGNLFLGVVLGNNMDWLTYSQHLWDDYRPQWHAPFIVVAPDGFGQPMYRWMAEREILDVIEDVQRHYAVDPDRVILTGLSNGGVGTYAIGTRHAWRFSVIEAMAGAPSWLQYSGGRPLAAERSVMEQLSGMHLAENTVNTDFRYYHGRSDTGPMRPPYVEQFEARMNELGIRNQVTWYDAGHDIHYRVMRRGTAYDGLVPIRRDRRPAEVRLVTADYRANRQHWVTATRLTRYPELSTVRARVEGARIVATTEGVDALSFDLRDAPVTGDEVAIEIDGRQAWSGPLRELGHVVNLRRGGAGWELGYPLEEPGMLVKRPGLSGPITDAYYDRMIHVYGTADPRHTDTLRDAARRGARGWPVWLWEFRQRVVADTEVTDEMMASAHLVVYGTESDNLLLNRMWERLPIRVRGGAVEMGGERFEGQDVGVRYVYPNPLSPDRYVIVQAAVSVSAVEKGHNLPDFVPDYVVYDNRTTRSRPRLMTGRNTPRAMGFFTTRWQLPGPPEGSGPDGGVDAADNAALPEEPPALPVPRRPPTPPRVREFLAPETDPNGPIAREIARRSRTFHNFRAEIPGGTWRVERDRTFGIRPHQACMDELARLGVPARPRPPQTTPVPSPVELVGPIDGVWFQSLHEDRPLVISCELATRLPALVEILKRHGVRGVDVMSAYRDHPRPSYHTMGMALDMSRFWTEHGWVSVAGHFLETPEHYTCRGPAGGRGGRILLRIACDLWESRLFNTVLTPNYNEGHRDHFHVDIRPDDFRFYLR